MNLDLQPGRRLSHYAMLHWTEHAVIAWLLIEPQRRVEIPIDCWKVCHPSVRPVAEAIYHFGDVSTLQLVNDLLEARGTIVIGTGEMPWVWGLTRDLWTRRDDDWDWDKTRRAFLERCARRQRPRNGAAK